MAIILKSAINTLLNIINVTQTFIFVAHYEIFGFKNPKKNGGVVTRVVVQWCLCVGMRMAMFSRTPWPARPSASQCLMWSWWSPQTQRRGDPSDAWNRGFREDLWCYFCGIQMFGFPKKIIDIFGRVGWSWQMSIPTRTACRLVPIKKMSSSPKNRCFTVSHDFCMQSNHMLKKIRKTYFFFSS